VSYAYTRFTPPLFNSLRGAKSSPPDQVSTLPTIAHDGGSKNALHLAKIRLQTLDDYLMLPEQFIHQ